MPSVHRILSNLVKKPKAKVAIDSLSNASSTQQLQRLVHNFKSSCESGRFRNNKAIYKLNVLRLAAAGQFSMIEDILEHQKGYADIRREGFAIRLIELYGLSGMLAHARKLFDELPQLKCPRTVKSLNALLKACVDAEKFGAAVEAFEELPRAVSIEPNLITYSTVIHALCEMGSFDGALWRLREMEVRGNEPNVVVFNTFLGSLYGRGRFLEGESIWEMMKSKNVEPDVRSYTFRLRGMFLEDRISEAVGLVGEMRRKAVKPDSFTYNVLIEGFSEKGQVKEAMKWYKKLKKSDCTPVLPGSYLAIISACHKVGDLNKAVDICFDAADLGVALEPAVIRPVIDSLVGKGMTEQATELEKLVNSSK